MRGRAARLQPLLRLRRRQLDARRAELALLQVHHRRMEAEDAAERRHEEATLHRLAARGGPQGGGDPLVLAAWADVAAAEGRAARGLTALQGLAQRLQEQRQAVAEAARRERALERLVRRLGAREHEAARRAEERDLTELLPVYWGPVPRSTHTAAEEAR